MTSSLAKHHSRQIMRPPIQSAQCNEIFARSIADYHIHDDVDRKIENPFDLQSSDPETQIKALLYLKNYIDTVQWHLEDNIRIPQIDPAEGLQIKRRIDKLNQERTDTVEKIDDWFFIYFENITRKTGARMNSESPAWVVDRLSILALKVYHMQIEAGRDDAQSAHREQCHNKLTVLLEQREDLSRALDELIEDILTGERYMKTYRQMKMYNDPSLNPSLYGQKG